MTAVAGGPKVLVADDDPGIRVSTAEILSLQGYSVTEAVDGDDATAKLADPSFDALVLDVRMPGRDGIAVLDGADPRPPPPGVLLVSAYDIGPPTRARLGARVCQVLRKPVPPPVLVDAVARAVRLGREARTERDD